MADKKILIVEDDPEIAASLSDILNLLGHQTVGIAESFDEAFAFIEKHEIDLVLLDIQLKGEKTGMDVAEKIGDQLPYIFTTAFADEETVRKASELGPYGYIVKPYGMKDINPAIEVALSNFQNAKKIKAEEGGFLSNHLYIKANSKLIRLDDDDILYIEAKGDYAVFKTIQKGYVVHSTIRNVIEKMNPQKFLKVHRSYVVNLDKIKDIEDSSILIEDKIIPVSRQHKPELMKRIDLI
ncbi:MAG: response regulator [Ekhidna sp.]|nr:response regulator [Ekhidna sp.]MBC6410261.1 response regulator [Ekhidna sp.]MBC6426108.1 response regulator [Ekhidna sp.]